MSSSAKERLKKLENANPRLKSIGSGALGFFSDFREFMLQDDVLNLAVGIIIGTAFVEVVNSVVKDLFSPFIALCGSGGNLDELFLVLRHGNGTDYQTLSEAKSAGAVTLNYGRFLETCVNLLMVSFCVFLTVKFIMSLRKKSGTGSESEQKIDKSRANCQKCRESVNLKAVRCPHCGVEPVQFTNHLKDDNNVCMEDNSDDGFLKEEMVFKPDHKGMMVRTAR